MQNPSVASIVFIMSMLIGGCASTTTRITASSSDDIVRQPLEVDNPAFPVAGAVMTRSGTDTVYVTGLLPTIVNPSAPKDSVQSYGNVETQTRTILNRIGTMLQKFGFGMGDIVKMTIYMVGEQGNRADYAGMLVAYAEKFGTREQPNKPARTAVQVVALRYPGALVEVEVIAAKSHASTKH